MGIQLRRFNPFISIVVPIFNEEENIDYFFSRMNKVLSQCSQKWEIIFIDDGSSDNGINLIKKLNAKNSNVRLIELSRNFGKEIALTAGLDLASGDVVIPIDADLQDPPEIIPQMIELWSEGFDVVLAQRSEREGETYIKKATAKLFYKLINKISDTSVPDNTGDFRLIDRKVLKSVNRLRETRRFMKGLFSWVGYRQTFITYKRDARFAGKTKWSYWKLWNFALEGVTSFSTLPLRLATYFGVMVAFSSFLYLLFIVIETSVSGVNVPGYASTLAVVLFLGGSILIFMGVIGEYLGRIYIEVKNRPIYIVKEKTGFVENNLI